MPGKHQIRDGRLQWHRHPINLTRVAGQKPDPTAGRQSANLIHHLPNIEMKVLEPGPDLIEREDQVSPIRRHDDPTVARMLERPSV